MFEMFPRESVGRANAALNLLHIGAAFVIQTGIGLIVGFWAPKLRGALYPAVAYTTAFWRSSCCSYWRLPGSYARRGGLHSMVLAYLCRSQTQRDTSAIESKADASHPLRLPLVTRDAPPSCGRKRGADHQAIGRSRGGRTTKNPRRRRRVRLAAAPDPAAGRGDVRWRRRMAPPMCIADAAYDSDAFRNLLKAGDPLQSHAQAHASLRRPYLSPAQRDRTHLLASQGLPPHRHALRATRECLSSVT